MPDLEARGAEAEVVMVNAACTVIHFLNDDIQFFGPGGAPLSVRTSDRQRFTERLSVKEVGLAAFVRMYARLLLGPGVEHRDTGDAVDGMHYELLPLPPRMLAGQTAQQPYQLDCGEGD